MHTPWDTHGKRKTDEMSIVQGLPQQVAWVQIPRERQEIQGSAMQGMRKAIPGHGDMILNRRLLREVHKTSLSRYSLACVSPTELPELISGLESHFEKVQADAAFLALKQSELRPDDHVSLCGVMEAQEQLHGAIAGAASQAKYRAVQPIDASDQRFDCIGVGQLLVIVRMDADVFSRALDRLEELCAQVADLFRVK